MATRYGRYELVEFPIRSKSISIIGQLKWSAGLLRKISVFITKKKGREREKEREKERERK